MEEEKGAPCSVGRKGSKGGGQKEGGTLVLSFFFSLSHSTIVTSFPGSVSTLGVSEVTHDVMVAQRRGCCDETMFQSGWVEGVGGGGLLNY